jgi:hypothetical protein
MRAEESANVSFRSAFYPRATVRRHAALFTDKQRVVFGGQRLHIAAFLQTLQQFILLQRPARCQLPSRIRVNSGTSSGSCG